MIQDSRIFILMSEQISHLDSLSKFKKWSWLIHLIFWSILMGVLILVHFQFLGEIDQAIGASIVNILGIALLVYAHLNWLLPRFFMMGKYLEYVLGLIIFLLSTASLRFFVGKSLIAVMKWPLQDIFNPRYFVSLVLTGIILVLLSLPLHLIENWIKKIELETELKTYQLEAELRFLKAQVNPHFLFNALNNIYSLSFTASEKAPEMILKLSDMMSYMLYDCKNDSVLLSSEIAYLRKYIDLQQLKKDGEFNIEFEVKGEDCALNITPMLFTPFFENAFKHGNLEDTVHGWMKSQLLVSGNKIHFTIENSTKGEDEKSKKGGVGLENIRERLKLLFPDRHRLRIKHIEHRFMVQLDLTLE